MEQFILLWIFFSLFIAMNCIVFFLLTAINIWSHFLSSKKEDETKNLCFFLIYIDSAWTAKYCRIEGDGVASATTNRHTTSIASSQRTSTTIFKESRNSECNSSSWRWTITSAARTCRSTRIKITTIACTARSSGFAENIQCNAE